MRAVPDDRVLDGDFAGSRRRQVDRDGRSLADLLSALTVPPDLMGEAVDLRQAEPGALADLLGGEERIEDLVEQIRRNADAGVAETQRDEIAGRADPLGGRRAPSRCAPDMANVPPSGMASRALTAMLTIASSNSRDRP